MSDQQETQYYTIFHGKRLVRRTPEGGQDRFDSEKATWVNIAPAISDWEFNQETDLTEISEDEARKLEPYAF